MISHRAVLAVVALAISLTALPSTCQAQDPTPPGHKSNAGQTAADRREHRSSPPPREAAPRNADRLPVDSPQTDQQAARQSQRRAKVQVAALALVGILLLGAFLLALPIVWGHRLRRMSRQPAPSCAPSNPLWFLKPSQPKAGEARTGEEENADEEQDASPGLDDSSSEPDGRGPA